MRISFLLALVASSMTLAAPRGPRIIQTNDHIQEGNWRFYRSIQAEGGVTGPDGGPLGVNYSGATGISVAGSEISCVAASGVAGGCLTTGVQTIAGNKTFSGEVGVAGLQADSYLQSPLIQCVAAECGTVFNSKRSAASAGADFTFSPKVQRTAGNLLKVDNLNDPGVFVIDPTGGVAAGASNSNTCSYSEGNGSSGHAALCSYAQLYLTVRGRSAETRAIETDGGRPIPDGGTWVQTDPDGGSYYSYAGLHGELTVVSTETRRGGWYFQAGQAALDYNGGYLQSPGLNLAQFGPIGTLRITTLGQYIYGQLESTQMYANDQHDWYYQSDSTAVAESGNWVRQGTKAAALAVAASPRYYPAILVNSAITVSTLGGFVAPARTAHLDALQFYVSASGFGGSDTANIRISDGASTCDFAFACNLSTGAKRVTASPTGCSVAASSTVTVTVTSIGLCSPGPTLLGNITPEGHW